MSIGQELLNVPMGDMIREMAFAIADAQIRLDEASVETAEMMGGLKTIVDDNGQTTFSDSRVFFGAEYMTVGEALVSQAMGADPDDGKAAMAAITEAGVSFPIKKFAADATGKLTIPSTAAAAGTTTPTAIENYEDVTEYMTQVETALAITSGTGVLSGIKKENAEANLEYNRAVIEDALSMEVRVPTRVSLLELGFAPVFYSFVDTIIEVKIAISISQSNSSSGSTRDRVKVKTKDKQFTRLPFIRGRRSKKKTVSTSQVNASYSNRYSYSAEGSTLLRTKLAPVPTPPLLEERIRALMEAEQDRKELKLEMMRARLEA